MMRAVAKHPLSRLALALSRGVNAVLMAVVRAYRFFLSPWLGSACRFTPTCSLYALEALDRHGPAAAAILAPGRDRG